MEKLQKALRFLKEGTLPQRLVEAVGRRLVLPFLPESVVLFNGRRIFLLKGDRGISVDLFMMRKREPGMTDFLLKEERLRGKVFLDIGANLGYYSLVLADRFEKIVAVEPNPTLTPLLERTLKGLGKNYEVIQKAVVGEERDFCELYLEGNSNLSTTLRPLGAKKSLRVPAVPLKELLERYRPEFVKMDLEGAEAEILGNKENLQPPPKFFFLEIHFNLLGEKAAKKVLRVLETSGYRIRVAMVEIKWVFWPGGQTSRILAKDIPISEFSQRFPEVLKGKLGAVEFLFVRE